MSNIIGNYENNAKASNIGYNQGKGGRNSVMSDAKNCLTQTPATQSAKTTGATGGVSR